MVSVDPNLKDSKLKPLVLTEMRKRFGSRLVRTQVANYTKRNGQFGLANSILRAVADFNNLLTPSTNITAETNTFIIQHKWDSAEAANKMGRDQLISYGYNSKKS